MNPEDYTRDYIVWVLRFNPVARPLLWMCWQRTLRGQQ